jgi:hypothetical protein
MPPALGVGKYLIGFHDVLEGCGTLGTNAVRVIEFGEFPVGMQDISGGRRPWDAEDEIIILQLHISTS